jgi:hypothetical protein
MFLSIAKGTATFFSSRVFVCVRGKAQEPIANRLNQDVSLREARQDPLAEAPESAPGDNSSNFPLQKQN